MSSVMLHDDEHPIDRILTAYFDRNHQITRSQSNNYKSDTRLLLQRQRVIRSFLHKAEETEPSIRKPITLKTKPQGLTIRSIPSPHHVLFADLNEPSPTPSLIRSATNKKDLQRQTPILIRRAPSIQASFDFNHIPSHQISVPLSNHFNLRQTSDQSSPKIPNVTKTPKLLREPVSSAKPIQRNSSQTIPKWTPTLFEKETLHQRTMHGLLRSKTYLLKTRPYSIVSSPTQMNSFPDLHISPRLEWERKRLMDGQWDNSRTNRDENLSDDDDDEDNADGDSSIATCNSRLNNQRSNATSSDSSSVLSSLTTDLSQTKLQQNSTAKRSSIRRAPYSLALPPLVEHLYDEETGDEYV